MEESAAKREVETSPYSNDEAMIAAASIMPRNESNDQESLQTGIAYHQVPNLLYISVPYSSI